MGCSVPTSAYTVVFQMGAVWHPSLWLVCSNFSYWGSMPKSCSLGHLCSRWVQHAIPACGCCNPIFIIGCSMPISAHATGVPDECSLPLQLVDKVTVIGCSVPTSAHAALQHAISGFGKYIPISVIGCTSAHAFCVPDGLIMHSYQECISLCHYCSRWAQRITNSVFQFWILGVACPLQHVFLSPLPDVYYTHLSSNGRCFYLLYWCSAPVSSPIRGHYISVLDAALFPSQLKQVSAYISSIGCSISILTPMESVTTIWQHDHLSCNGKSIIRYMQYTYLR